MKLSVALASTLFLFATTSVAALSDSTCAAAKAKKSSDEVCALLIDDCTEQVASESNIWGIDSCVAAATCDGTHNLIQLAKCTNPSMSDIAASDFKSLDYGLYADIVGECAWQSGGCPITRQNYIDFIYRTLDDLCTDVWPDVNDVINDWWTPINDWTATGQDIPYLNFNDWLHWSNSQIQ